MAAFQRRLVAAERFDVFPAQALIVHDSDQPIIARTRHFEIVDGELPFQNGFVRSHQLCGTFAASTCPVLSMMMTLDTPVAAQKPGAA